MAVVIWFTWLETKGLTLEQIDQRFQGVPRDQLVDIVDVYNGEKPVAEAETVPSSAKETITESKAV